MTLSELTGGALILGGMFFFLAGTIGLIRFPDFFTRLHALTKADNLGLGLIVAGLALRAEAWPEVFKLIATWFLVLGASATVCFVLAGEALRQGQKPWTKT